MNPLRKFVPYCAPIKRSTIQECKNILASIDKLLVLTGAGISTESGIPDYRSEGVGLHARTNHRPITHQNFMKSQLYRRRYWARNFLAWSRFSTAPFNKTHATIADWEISNKRFLWLITQNVDGLHTLAGSKQQTELHGCTKQTICMNCKKKYPRSVVQDWISELNKDWTVSKIGEVAPDGDVEIPISALYYFNTPYCPKCGVQKGILKTDVVFFGDCIQKDVAQQCNDKVEECSGMLVLGSSLSVMSSYRLVYQAFLQKKPIVIINIGPTRADPISTLKISTVCSEIVGQLNV